MTFVNGMFIFFVFLFVEFIFVSPTENIQPNKDSQSLISSILWKSINDESVNADGFVYSTFMSREVNSYAGYFQHYNRHYFQRENATVRYFTEETGHNYYPSDMRWNKIAILVELLRKYLNSKAVRYIVFFDADILFLNDSPANFIKKLININPNIEVFMSQDLLDFANSGLIIAKVSKWTLKFFTRWWELQDSPNTFCDQHALNILSMQLEQENLLKNIGILPFGVINSQWPPLENYNPEFDNVLHLLGEYDFVRTHVGKYFANQQNLIRIQQSEEKNSPSKNQLLKLKVEALNQALTQSYQALNLPLISNIVNHICEMQLRFEHTNDSLVTANFANDYIGSFEEFLRSMLPTGDQATPSYVLNNNETLQVKEMLLDTLLIKLKCFPIFTIISSAQDLQLRKPLLKPKKQLNLPILSSLRLLEDIIANVDYSRAANKVFYHQQRLKIFETIVKRLHTLLTIDVSSTADVIENLHDQQFIWQQAWKYSQKSKNDSNILYKLIQEQDSLNEMRHTIRLQHLKQQQSIIQLQLLKPTLFGFQERNQAWQIAHDTCDESLPLIESLQEDYSGESRLLINQVRDILKLCYGIYEKRRDTKGLANNLTKFVNEMRYFGNANYVAFR